MELHTPDRELFEGHEPGHEWSTPVKNYVIGQLDAGVSKHQIAKKYGLDHSIQLRWQRERTQSESAISTDSRRGGKKRSGRPTILGKQEIKEIIQWILKQKYSGRRKPFQEVIQQLHLSCSQFTLVRALASQGYHKCKACPKPFINDNARKKRLELAIKYQNWMHEWKRLRFSDECTFTTEKHKKDWILRIKGERYCPDCIQHRFHSGRASFTVWAMIG